MEDNWGLSFMVPGMILGAGGFIIWLFMVPKPKWVDLEEEESTVSIHFLRVLAYFWLFFVHFCPCPVITLGKKPKI